MIVRTTAPDSNAAYWADFTPHRVRMTSAPTQRTYVVAPEPTRDEAVVAAPIAIPPTDSQGEHAPAQPVEQR